MDRRRGDRTLCSEDAPLHLLIHGHDDADDAAGGMTSYDIQKTLQSKTTGIIQGPLNLTRTPKKPGSLSQEPCKSFLTQDFPPRPLEFL